MFYPFLHNEAQNTGAGAHIKVGPIGFGLVDVTRSLIDDGPAF